MTEATEYHPLYLRGIDFFNRCEFFESHEAWEELWADNFGASRKFLQGLIQAAVALHHFGNGNLGGARKLFYGSRGYLEPYRPVYMGLNVDKFLTEMKSCFAEIIDPIAADRPKVEIVPDLIPEIHLDPPAPAE